MRQDRADEVASYAGIGIGLTTLLRATPYRLVHDEIPIPAELLRPNFPYKQLFGEEHSLGEADEAEWLAAVQQMTETAEAHMDRAKQMYPQLPRAARPVFLPMIPSMQFLERLVGSEHNLMNAKLHEPLHLQLLLRLGRSWLTGRL